MPYWPPLNTRMQSSWYRYHFTDHPGLALVKCRPIFPKLLYVKVKDTHAGTSALVIIYPHAKKVEPFITPDGGGRRTMAFFLCQDDKCGYGQGAKIV